MFKVYEVKDMVPCEQHPDGKCGLNMTDDGMMGLDSVELQKIHPRLQIVARYWMPHPQFETDQNYGFPVYVNAGCNLVAGCHNGVSFEFAKKYWGEDTERNRNHRVGALEVIEFFEQKIKELNQMGIPEEVKSC